jgi:chromosome segregation ATPase
MERRQGGAVVSKHKNSKDALEIIHTLDSLAIKKQKEEIERLKAEVERLTSDIQMEKENEDRLVREWQRANNEVYGLQTQVAALIDDQTRLKEQVERLTKAGDAMAARLMYQGYPETVPAWNAAKEGKQS